MSVTECSRCGHRRLPSRGDAGWQVGSEENLDVPRLAVVIWIWGMTLTHDVEPSSPFEIGYCEGFDCKLPDECLNSGIFLQHNDQAAIGSYP